MKDKKLYKNKFTLISIGNLKILGKRNLYMLPKASLTAKENQFFVFDKL